MAEINPSFSMEIEGLQLVWDTVSTGAAKACWRRWDLSIRQGWVTNSQQVDLEFGLLYHAACEFYDRLKLQGVEHDEALVRVVRRVLTKTWNKEKRRPWTTEDPNKNRYTLVRTIVWYLEKYKEDKIDLLALADGTPAVELTFKLDTHRQAGRSKDSYMLTGHLDKVGVLDGKPHIFDKKSTKHTLSPSYFNQFNPNGQFSHYTFGGKVAFDFDVQGVVVDAAQVAVGFSRFERKFIPRSDAQLEEWFRGMENLWDQAEKNARDKFWPMNEESCFLCHFKKICGKNPDVREMWLKADFSQRMWNPLADRGDV